MFNNFLIKKVLPLSLIIISSFAMASQNPFVKPETKAENEYGSEQQKKVEVRDIDLKNLEKNLIKQEEPVEVELFMINGSVLYKNKQDSTYRMN